MREIALQFWSVPRAGEKHERFDAPDPDWCEHHGLSRYDHQANGRCCYPEPS
jgi:hypothetical protein